MTALYVANPTKQIQSIHIRFVGTGAPMQATVPPGTQIKLFGKDFNGKEMEAVMKYAHRYGWKEYNAVDRGGAGMATIIYSTDKPIPVSKTLQTSEKNTDVLIVKGKEIRDQLAVAINNTLENQAQENNLPAQLAKMEMTVLEEDSKGGQPHGLDPISEARRVTRRDDQGGARQSGKRKGRRN